MSLECSQRSTTTNTKPKIYDIILDVDTGRLIGHATVFKKERGIRDNQMGVRGETLVPLESPK